MKIEDIEIEANDTGYLDEPVIEFVMGLLDEGHDTKDVCVTLMRHAGMLALSATKSGHQVAYVLLHEFVDTLKRHIVNETLKDEKIVTENNEDDVSLDDENTSLKMLPSNTDIIH